MKYKSLFLLFGLVLIFAAGCPSPDGGGSALKVFYGTITVFDSSYWTKLVLGIFSGGDGALDYDTEDFGSTIYRLVYYDQNNDSDVDIPQVSGATSSIDSSGDTSRTYSFELPEKLPGEDEYYHVVCFYDNDEDGNIDLKDSFDPAIAVQGEFNRFPTKETTNLDDEPTTINVFGFVESMDLNGNPSGNYKYYGSDEEGYNEQQELSEEFNKDFDFNITDISGGW
jgi:hypothetical protein